MNFRCCGYHHYGEYLDYIKLLVAAVTQTAPRPFCSAPAAAGRRRMHSTLDIAQKEVLHLARETKNEDQKQRIRDAFQEGQAVERMPARYIVISEDITGVLESEKF